MATSPLFGWEEPDDVDLVKDGAAAIRTLGNAIDTSMGDLLGGTTGQVLSKASNTNMDFTWVTSDDANAIQNTIVDAKADLITATAADTPARLAVGADYTILQALASESTGLRYTGGWTTYTPTWTGSITNPAIGNGALTGGYRRIGSQVDFWVNIGMGSTTTFGSGTWRIGLPIVAQDSVWNFGHSVAMLDSGVAWYPNYAGQGVASGLNSSFEIITVTNSASVNPTTPFTWANGDQIFAKGSYRVA